MPSIRRAADDRARRGRRPTVRYPVLPPGHRPSEQSPLRRGTGIALRLAVFSATHDSRRNRILSARARVTAVCHCLAMSVLAIVISGLALLVAAWAAVSAHRSQRQASRSADAARELVHIERERRADELAHQNADEYNKRAANIVAATDRVIRHELAEETLYDYRFCISNTGPHEARDLSFELRSVQGEGLVPSLEGQPASGVRLLVGAEQTFNLIPNSDVEYNPDIAECRVRWSDSNGSHNEIITVTHRSWT